MLRLQPRVAHHKKGRRFRFLQKGLEIIHLGMLLQDFADTRIDLNGKLARRRDETPPGRGLSGRVTGAQLSENAIGAAASRGDYTRRLTVPGRVMKFESDVPAGGYLSLRPTGAPS